MLSCSDQISPPALKSEIMDENSQSSILSSGPDTMSHDSMDHFANENSMDGSNSAPSQVNMLAATPLELIMQKNAALSNAFQPTMDQGSLMEIASNVVDLRVKQEEQMVAQIQELVNQNSSDNVDMLAAVNRPAVDTVPMFVQTAATTANAATADVLFNNSMGQNVVTAAPTDHQMQQALEQTNAFPTHSGLMTEAGTATTMNHILSYPGAVQALSPNIMSTSPTSNSPLSQDVMLNSQPAAVLNASPNMINGGNASSIAPITPITTSQSESDIILNPTISPTMMCHNTSADANNLMSNAVTMGETTMLAATLPAAQQPTTSDAILTNLMQPMSIKQSPVAVKNMILNAAADILSSEPNSITAETTMNALMSLNSAPMCTQERSSPTLSATQGSSSPPNVSLLSQPTSGMMMPNHHHYDCPTTQSIANILTNNNSTSSVVVLAGNNQLIQNVVAAAAAQNATEIIQNQIVPAESMLNNYAMPNHIAPQMINVQSTPSAATAGLNQVQQNFLNNLQWVFALNNLHISGDSLISVPIILFFFFFRQEINIAVTEQNQSHPQESVLQAVSLVRNDIPSDTQKLTQAQLTNVINGTTVANAATNATGQPTTQTGTIPQEIATMSEHDLISYINPSCFE